MRRVLIIALMLAFTARAQDAGVWWGALAASDDKPDVLDGLVAWWKLDADATDIIGGYDGTIIGATNATGKINGCYGFNGISTSGDCILCGASVIENITTNVTFSAWINVYSYKLSDGHMGIVGIGATPAESFCMWANAPNNVLMRIKTTETTSLYAYGSLAVGWNFVCCVYDGASMFIYVNGGQVAAVAKTGSVDKNILANFAIGRPSDYSGAEYFNGLIDDVRIYNRALSSNEVNTVYNRFK